jgi:VCBS repeat-containing protein
MNILETYYTYAKLSQAAYIDLSPAKIGTDNPFDSTKIVDAASSQERVPQYLAENIFGVGNNTTPNDTWTMLSPYYKTGSWLGSNTGHSDPTSGFAGMLLSNPVYGKVLSIAGTEPTNGASQFFYDLMFSDIGQIGLIGAALNQLTSLFNYVQELKAPAGATNVLRLEVVQQKGSLESVLLADPTVVVSSGGTRYSLVAHYDGQSKNVAGQPLLIAAGEQLTVTGHSLGGHVAALAAALFPEIFTTAYTFNAPGYDPITSGGLLPHATNRLLDLFKPYGANPLTVESVASHVITIEAEDAIPGDDNEIVSSSVTGTPFSPETFITTEKVTHDIGHLTESLALQSMLAKLDSSMTATTGGNILSSMTAQPADTYEKLLESLSLLLTGKKTTVPVTCPTATETYVTAGGGDFAARNTFFEKYFALQSSEAFKKAAIGTLTVFDLSALTAAQIASVAQDNIAFRYALSELSPFAVSGLNKSNYAVGDALDVYDPVTQTGRLSTEYLTDRSKLLQLVIKRNLEDISSNLDGSLVLDTATRIYTDATFGINILPQGADVLPQEQYAQVHFGNGDNEVLKGGFQDDRLYGMVGDDTLQGGLGNDYLEGGRGVDSYVWNSGDGNDTIFDYDKLGQINVNGQNLSVAKRVSLNKWRDERNITYTLQNNGSDQALLINTGNGSMRVNHFKSGDLGITLSTEFVMPYFVQNNPVPLQGDRMPFQYSAWNFWAWFTNPTWPYLFDGYGNIVRTTGLFPSYPDKMYGTGVDNVIAVGDGTNVVFATNGKNTIVSGVNEDLLFGGQEQDQIYAGGSADIITTNAGDDLVWGEAGRDVIDGGAGDDFLLGGSDSDAMNGGAGDDQLYGGEYMPWELVVSSDGASTSGLPGNIETGGSGDDLVVGSTLDDALLGGVGTDVLSGQGGDDVIFGDSDMRFVAPPISIFAPMLNATRWPLGPYLNYSTPYTSSPVLSITYQRIDHGQNAPNRFEFKLSSNTPEVTLDNWILPAIGGGDDVLYGGSGSDWLFGEFGNDILDGGAGNDVLVGGVGDDVMLGGTGNDTYVINAGDGIDRIYDSQANGDINTLVFGVGVDPANIKLFQGSLGLDLGNGSVVHIEGVDYNDIANTSSIQRFEFADGTVLTAQELVARGFDLNGTAGNDTISGTNVVDRIVAGAGDDVLSGGVGNDILNGGAGNDTYLFNIGDGADRILDNGAEINTLVFGAGITAAMITPVTNANGTITLDLGNGDRIDLQSADNLAIQSIQFADGSSVTTESLLNAPPVAHADAITVYEDGGVVSVPTDALLANDTDPNANDVIAVVAVGESALGASVSLNNGQVQYDIGNRFQTLGAGQTLTDTFAYTIQDRKGAADSSVVNVTITGVNDAPVTTADDATAVQEDGCITASGNVLANDSDVDQGTVLAVENAGIFTGNYGNLVLNVDGSYTYTLDNASLSVQSLAAGQVVTETFAYQATDGFISTPSTLTVTLTGSNDAPVTTVDTAAVQEDLNIAASGNVLSNDSDVDQGAVLTVANAGIFTGNYGSLVLNVDGSYAYTLDNASLSVQSLAAGQIVTETFAYQATDGFISTPSTLTVTLTGSNDAPVTTVDTAAVQEDLNIAASGNVLSNDSDVDQNTVLTVVNAGLQQGGYGQLNLLANGDYTYVLDNASLSVQSLAAGQVVTETFAYQATDGFISTPSTLTVTLTGSNDAPMVAADIGNMQTLEDTPFSFTVPSHTFSDIDQGDTLTYQATLADGHVLPSWMRFDAATLTLSGTPNNQDVGVFNIALTATDTGGLTATSQFDFTVQNVNDAPIVVNQLADQYVEKNRRFNIVANGFADWDGIHGDTLTYRATLTNGKPLPSWLKFDAVTHSFSGKTVSSGNWDIVLTATDQSLASVAQIFNLSTQKSDRNEHDLPTDTTQDEIFTSGSQNDIIHTGNGADTLIFKRGSGQDTLYGGIGTDNTVALDSGIHLADLSLSKTGNDLILEMGNHDQINLKSWYDNSANYHSLLNLQVVAEATAEFDRTSKDASSRLQNFDFTAIAHAFDVARGTSDTLQHWKMMDSVTTARLNTGNGEAHNSDSSNLSRAFLRDLPQTATQDVIHTTLFCDQSQNFKSFVGL